MLSQSPLLAGMLALIGLVSGAVIAVLATRLARFRVPEAPLAPSLLLTPVVGPIVTRWRLGTTLALEALCASLLVGLYLHYGWSVRLLLGSTFSLFLLLIAYIDFEHRLVLNWLSLPGTGAALAVSWLWPGLGILSAVIGAAAGLALFLVLAVLGRGALGM